MPEVGERVKGVPAWAYYGGRCEMKNWEKAYLAERIKFYASFGCDKHDTITKCVRLGFKESTVRQYYKVFIEKAEMVKR